MKRKRSPRRGSLDFAAVVSGGGALSECDALWCGHGYERGTARAFRRRDGTFTVRLVWRKRGDLPSTVTYTLEGLALP